MGRLDRRIQRLTARVQGKHASLQQARLQRMTDKELEAEVATIAAKHGCPADQVPTNLDAAINWTEERMRTLLEATPEEERKAYVAQHITVRAPSGRPWA